MVALMAWEINLLGIAASLLLILIIKEIYDFFD